MHLRAFPTLLLGALGFAGVLRGAVTPDPTTDSPFLPPSASATAATVTEGAPIELHGIMATPEGLRFSIFDPSKKSANWVRVNERGLPYVVRQYSVVDGSDQVKVDYQGSTLTLGLKTAKIAAMTTAQPQGGPGQFGGGPGLNRGGPNAVTQSVVVNPSPADEAARLQAVVDAVAARRAARNQAVQQPANGQVPQNLAPANVNQPGQPGQGRQRQPRQQQQQK
jgi:hypothetical protein